MTAHTPGPWTYDADDKLNPDRAFGINRPWQDGDETGTETIAEVCHSNVPGRAEADARLIAAALDMLAALEHLAAVGEAGVIERRETGKPMWSVLDEIKTISRAAIAKAKGDSQ